LHPVLVEASAGFLAAGLLQGSFGLWTSVDEPVPRGRLRRLAALGALSFGSEIDEVAHGKLGGNQICGFRPSWPALVWNNYADTVTLDHGKPRVCAFDPPAARREV